MKRTNAILLLIATLALAVPLSAAPVGGSGDTFLARLLRGIGRITHALDEPQGPPPGGRP